MRGGCGFLVLLPLLTKLVHTAEPTTMLDAVMVNCSLDESLKEKYESLQEFKGCNNWTAIKSVDFSDENKIYIKCRLYHDSLVSLCRQLNPANVSSIILSTEPDDTSINKICELFVYKQNESLVLKDIQPDWCRYLCWEMPKPKMLIIDPICAKSYTFLNYNYKKNDTEKVVSVESNAKEPVKNFIETGNNIDLTQTQEQTDGDKNKSMVSDPSPNFEENKKSQIDVAIYPKLIEMPIENDKNITIVNVLNLLKSDQKPVDGDENKVIQKQVVKVDKQEINTRLDNVPEIVHDQQDSPTNSNTNIQSTDQGQTYQDDDDVAYRLEKDQKIENSPVETAQESFDDKEDLIPNDFKKPEVSPLSESFGYDSDLNDNSYFFSYFSFTCVVLIIGYVFYHNKQKVIALLVEGRHSRRPQRTRRPNSANYSKLDSNLEEAISSSVSKNPSHVIY